MLGASLGETEGHIYTYTIILCNNILLTVNKVYSYIFRICSITKPLMHFIEEPGLGEGQGLVTGSVSFF